MAHNHFNDVPVRPDYFGPASLEARPTRRGFLPALKDGVSAPEIR